MKVKVFAKLNLTLFVGGKKGKFHSVDSLVTSVDVFDEVEVAARADEQVIVHCDGIEPENNSACRAAVAFKEAFCTPGVEIFVKKGIPIGAGMGGSSADAAATVYCMCKLFGVDVRSKQVHALCAQLGSDVNFMLRGGFARMQGKGDDLTFSALGRQLYFALTTFDKQMLTSEVYAKYDELFADAQLQKENSLRFWAHDLPNSAQSSEQAVETFVAELAAHCHNDLQSAAQSLSDYADEYIAFVTNNLHLSCTMSGSGSAYFVVFEQKEQAERVVNLLVSGGFSARLCRSVTSGIGEK